jgi:patatin-like phospholipase/acyl hydrolase
MMENIQRILSIDGGGVRGIIPATILAAIEERTGKRISELFDLIAGTSTGGILALGLTKPDPQQPEKPQFSARQLCQLYQEKIPLIFQDPQSWWGNLIGPKYKSFALQAVLKEAFEECRLKNSLSHVLIPCYDIEHRVPYLFNSRLARIAPEHDFQMRDVALAASASPTVFHPVRFPRAGIAGRQICLVDGGVFANNPSICALSESKAENANNQKSIFIVSLGTGKSHRTLSDEFVSLWGYVQWSVPMLELVMESNSECTHQQMQYLMPNTSYHRVQVELNDMSAKLAIDDASSKNLKALKQCADEFCSEPKNLEAICNSLLLLSERRAGSFIG